MTTKAEYEKLSDVELEKENQRLQDERVKIGQEQERIAAIRDQRSAEARATMLLDGLSSGERDVLIEAAAARVESESKTPGGDG